ncbi:MAG TPA: hypothetical protein VIC33_13350 [Vicinamibacterales bacterium]|jgi:hypothetical protein
MRRLAVVFIMGVALAASGCLDVQESITLNRNMSGQAGFVMNVDGEPLVPFMAQMQRQMAGKSGPPTAADLAAARAAMLKDADASDDFEKDKRDMQQHLPAGVKLLNASYNKNGLKSTANVSVSFDNAAALGAIVFDQGDKQEGGPGNPVSQPFDGLKVVDDGQTLLITSAIVNPAEGAKAQAQQMPMDPAMQKQFATLLSGMHVAVKITAPFTVLEQNATRQEGNTLIWEFDSAHLQSMTPDQLKSGIRVRYKK